MARCFCPRCGRNRKPVRHVRIDILFDYIGSYDLCDECIHALKASFKNEQEDEDVHEK